MNTKFLSLIFIGIIALVGVAFFLSKNENNQPADNSGIIYFYGIGCPHCAKVDEFLKENDVESKIKFVKKEVRFNQQNADLLLQKAKICGVKEDEIGVPFLWDGENSKCIIGDEPIIEFFKEKIGQK